MKDVVGGDDNFLVEEVAHQRGVVDGPHACPETELLGLGNPGGVRLVVTEVIVDATYAGILELLRGEVGTEIGGDGAEAFVDELQAILPREGDEQASGEDIVLFNQPDDGIDTAGLQFYDHEHAGTQFTVGTEEVLEQGDGLAIGKGGRAEVGIGGAGNLHALEGVVVVDDELAVEGLVDIELGAVDVLPEGLAECGQGVLGQAVARPAAPMGHEGYGLLAGDGGRDVGCLNAVSEAEQGEECEENATHVGYRLSVNGERTLRVRLWVRGASTPPLSTLFPKTDRHNQDFEYKGLMQDAAMPDRQKNYTLHQRLGATNSVPGPSIIV